MGGDDQGVGNDLQHNFNSYNATCTAPAPSSSERGEEWQNLIQKLPTDLDEMGAAFVVLESKQIVDGEKPFAALRRGNTLVRELTYVADEFRESGLLDRWNELVKSIETRDFAAESRRAGYSPLSCFLREKTVFLDELIRAARKDLKD